LHQKWRTTAFFNSGFLKEAEYHHEKAMLIDESREKFRNSSWYCYTFALVKVSLGKISEAEQLGLKAIETVTQWVPIRHYLVYIPLFSVYAQQGKYAKIHRFIEELERNSPEDHAHRFFKQYRGILVFKNGNFENAKQFWIQGLKHETQVPEHDLLLFFESALCAATVMLNDWSAALDYSKQAIASRNYPSLPYVEGGDYWHFG
jgi:tetratricopeptide (TPR) repeat protein